ncbi:putative pre-mRNA splicing factor [Talaromyces proteolyticus]|uniref:U4/U6 snRNA-associated-splicing factor PRP24 n=1 Tax=Talaromyces proteolyticus TaxID=1131652 RepID=A0AAD4KQJ9_9EURO|nr:putative pre-mRNA splicing factor [Talaromyces proteolyticus]KAH8693899.1 putative pre-mRNA splicing factor [Talaromyces proteolyticus]
MDIKQLLSPQESAAQSRQSTPTSSTTKSSPSASSVPSSTTSPHKNSRRGRPSASKFSSGPSPVARQALESRLPDRAGASNSHNAPAGNGNASYNDMQAPRQSATSINALADVAALQDHQSQAPKNPPVYPNMSSFEPLYPTPKPVPSIQNPPRAPEPREHIKRDYGHTSLPAEAQQQAAQLFSHIQENPHSYESHVQFVRLLHTGFVNHVYPPHNPDAHGDPRGYDLLNDLRSAREEMDKLFAMGEDLWIEWIQDETLIARSVDERIAVLELCRRSVEEEYGSTKLWTMFGDWMLYLYNAAMGQSDQNQWSEEDRIVGREVFNWQSVLDIWQRGAEATRWRVNDSHRVWNKFLELSVQDLAHARSSERVSQVRGLFDSRLQTPHAAWDETSQIFSSFVTSYYSANYEELMVETNARASDAKMKYDNRRDFEIKLQKAEDSQDPNLEWAVYTEYIEWELNRHPEKRIYSAHLINALYQRALLRFPTDVAMWEDYVTFLVQMSPPRPDIAPILPTLERATRHCPWSGTLWSQFLLVAEREGWSFNQISQLKHTATSTGLLDAGGLEEVIKVHSMWCSYLRRHAFLPDGNDEDLDVAEVGIRSAIERVQELGENKYGKAYQGDPYFRLERIYTRYLSESGSWDSAREYYKSLIPRRGNSYEFWLDYYNWEIMSWRTFVEVAMTPEAARRTPGPSYATAVLKQAIKRPDLDWPEKIVAKYIAHCEDYEDADELQEAFVETQKAMKVVTRRRQKEALEQRVAQEQQQAAALAAQAESDSNATVFKRKREEEASDVNGLPTKKARPEDAAVVDQQEPVELKRDRENSTVIVKRLPLDISEPQIRQFFRECGVINDIRFLPPDEDLKTAIVEFDSKEDAATALTRDQKRIDGSTVDVEMGVGSTVYVTNFPPTADEAYIKDLLNEFGEIVDVRFPSLKYNTHRRFCYVQFKSAGEAIAATKLDGTVVGDNLHLQVKISNPTQKQDRHGPIYEGREVHVSNVHFKASESDLKEVFSQYGTVEIVRLPTKVSGEHRGFGFVVFSSPEEATASLAMHQQEFRGRPLQVKMSTPTPVKRSAVVVSHKGRSPSLEPNGATAKSTEGDERAARTLGLMNIPDTVNDSRIRSITEKFGTLIKIILRPEHEGAIVEFSDVKAAGKASMELEGYEIVPGRKIHVGSARDLVRPKDVASSKAKPKHATVLPMGIPVKRPTQPGVSSSRRRGGLGFKRGGATAPDRSHNHDQDHDQTMGDASEGSERAGEKKPQKSNEDFRAMIQGNAK